MHTIFIAPHEQALRCAVVVAAAMLGGGCLWEVPPAEVTVRGTATGVVAPVPVEMRISEGIETLVLTQDGPFAFEWRLEVGASYDVSLADERTPCTVRQPRYVITDADTAIELTCTGASLASVRVSGVAVTLVPGTTAYEVVLPLLQQSVTVTATVATAGDTMTIAGTPVASGLPSAPITLSLGDNPVDIVVENALGWRRTYRLTLRRAASRAQYAYDKASSIGHDDHFGDSVSVSGDTLAVGAHQEASASQGMGGDPDDDAEGSGAVYIFH